VFVASSSAIVETPSPKASKAYLSVESNVSGAKVFVDGRYIGTTNLSGIKISPGEHRVRVEKDGYEPYLKRVRFKSGRSMSLTVFLDKRTAPKSSLNVYTNPNDAKVRILNIGQKFYQGIELKSGRYHVEVSADEYETKKLMVTLVSGEDKSIDVRLKKRAVAPSSSYSSYGSAKEIESDGRFVAYDNGTVKDTKTGLMWASKDNGEDITWKGAKRYCENYRGGRYTDWRMPTQDELAGLYDKSESYQAKQRDYDVHLTKLIQLTTCCPRASETNGSEAAFFDFGGGRRDWSLQSYYRYKRALPVRGGK